MDHDLGDLSRLIGARVRAERQARSWTLDRLAETAGVSRRMLVNVEQGAVNPSVGTLLRLSDALGIGLPVLVEPPSAAGVRVTRAGEGAVLWSGHHGGRGVLVGGTEPPDVVELWDWTLAPGDSHVSEPHSRGTRELLQVLSGTLRLEVEGHVHVLETGDGATFRGDVAHSYAADAGARFSLAVFEPGVGARDE